MHTSFQKKQKTLTFLAQICSKIDLVLEIQKINVGINITMCANFQTRRATLTFATQICPAIDLRLKIHNTSIRIRISILEIPYMPIFRQNGKLWDKHQHPEDNMCAIFQERQTTLTFLVQICSKIDL